MWGLQQYGIRAIVAPSFGEIFHSNAMNNRLLLVMLPPAQIARLMDVVDDPAAAPLTIDVTAQTLQGGGLQADFTLLPRHRRMFIEGLDAIGLALTLQRRIESFAQAHWTRQPWLKDVARLARDRLAR